MQREEEPKEANCWKCCECRARNPLVLHKHGWCPQCSAHRHGTCCKNVYAEGKKGDAYLDHEVRRRDNQRRAEHRQEQERRQEEIREAQLRDNQRRGQHRREDQRRPEHRRDHRGQR